MRSNHGSIFVLAFILASCSPEQGKPTHISGMVASAHPVATEAGLEILRAGGNAFDAAVAIASTLNVVEPMMSGMGGYGTIMVYSAEAGSPFYLDASGKIPTGVDADVYRAPTPDYMENRVGAKAVSTPGASHAWGAMHERYGTLAWADLLQPAIRAADEGFLLDERSANFIGDSFDEFSGYSRSIYGSDGKPLDVGDRLVQKDLAGTLRQLADEGPAAIYGGTLGQAIDEAMRSAGGFLTMVDLENHEAEWWTPLHLSYRGHDIYTPSAPAGAFPMLERLGMMDMLDSRDMGHNSLEYLHHFAEVTKMAYWDRLAYSGDPDVKPPPYERLFAPDYWRSRIATIDAQKAREFDYSGIVSANSENTTHFVVADQHGNIVSATVTLGGLFGSKIMPEGTGTPGGHTITQTVSQMIMNLLDFGMGIEAAISAPRIAFIEPDTLAVEETFPESVRGALADMGHKIQVRDLGNANGVSIEYREDGSVRFTGASDPRGSGLASGLQEAPARPTAQTP